MSNSSLSISVVKNHSENESFYTSKLLAASADWSADDVRRTISRINPAIRSLMNSGFISGYSRSEASIKANRHESAPEQPVKEKRSRRPKTIFLDADRIVNS